jgi:hypothetical protein
MDESAGYMVDESGALQTDTEMDMFSRTIEREAKHRAE